MKTRSIDLSYRTTLFTGIEDCNVQIDVKGFHFEDDPDDVNQWDVDDLQISLIIPYQKRVHVFNDLLQCHEWKKIDSEALQRISNTELLDAIFWKDPKALDEIVREADGQLADDYARVSRR